MSIRTVVTSVAIATSISLITGAALADQAAWISKRDADAGAALVSVGQELRDYCAPCGDRAYTARTVSRVDVTQTDASHWQVRVNGRGIDLAYVYVLVHGHWQNIAMIVGVPVTGVPAELPSSVARKP